MTNKLIDDQFFRNSMAVSTGEGQILSESTAEGIAITIKPVENKIDPNHYKQGSIEPIDFILANNMNFLEGNVIKYVSRYKFKNGVEDLKKAKFYLEKLISEHDKL